MIGLLATTVSFVESYKICASVIVRDESKVIERFLEHNQWVFHRLDLVDTGSSDNTVELVQKFAATHK